jgi:hypothetical protein
MSGRYKVAWLCEAILVSRSGYYDWKQRRSRPGPREVKNTRLRLRIGRSLFAVGRPMAVRESLMPWVVQKDATASPGSCAESNSSLDNAPSIKPLPLTAATTDPLLDQLVYGLPMYATGYGVTPDQDSALITLTPHRFQIHHLLT